MNEELGMQLFDNAKMGNLERYINTINPNVKVLGINSVNNYDMELERYELNENLIASRMERPQSTEKWDNSKVIELNQNIINKKPIQRILERIGQIGKIFSKNNNNNIALPSAKNEENEKSSEKKEKNIFALTDEEKARHNLKTKEIVKEYKERQKTAIAPNRVNNDLDR